MAQKNAAELFKAVQQDQALKEKLKAAADPEAFIKIAQEHGYHFSAEELESAIGQLSEEDLAAIVNPGVSPRHHLYPR
ncbi:MAG: Nif11-like leader peptide family natural product precursor [Microcystaceae cyanobacterium]